MGQLSVQLGEKSQIKLLRPVTQEYILKERDGKIQPHFKKFWSKEEKEKVKSGDIPVKRRLPMSPKHILKFRKQTLNLKACQK